MEVINHNPALYLFGAGHIGQALCQILEGKPFRIHLIDGRPARYVGMVGSKNKWDRVRKNLEKKGLDLSQVTCPIGHDNGGGSPQEIAISTASQLLSTYYGRE